MAEGRRRQKFLICDPSLSGAGGHYLNYDLTIGKEFQRRGFEVAIAASDAYAGDREIGGIRIASLFRYEIWGRLAKDLREPISGITEIDRRYVRLKYSKWGSYWAACESLKAFQHYNSDFPLPPDALDELKLVATVHAENKRLALAQDEALLLEGVPAGPEKRELVYRTELDRLKRALAHVRKKEPALAEQPSDRNSLFGMLTHSSAVSAAFDVSIGQAFELFGISAGDHIFCPNMSYLDLRGLATFIEKRRERQQPRFHVLFRRNAYSGLSSNWDSQEWGVHGKRTAFALFRQFTQDADVSFNTDTDLLTAQMNRFDGPTFRTVPIPVNLHVDSSPASMAHTGTFLALTDAMDHDLPYIVEAISGSEIPARIQAVALKHDSSDDIRASQERLMRMQDTDVLHSHLPADEIAAEIERAGTVRVPALPTDPFGSLSSSFWTALRKGRAVLASPDTWQQEVVDHLNEVAFRKVESGGQIDVLQHSQLRSLSWHFFGWNKSPWPTNLLSESGLAVTNRGASYAWIKRDTHADQLWVSVLAGDGDRVTLAVRIAQHSEIDSQTVYRDEELFLSSGLLPGSVCFELSPETGAVWIGLRLVGGSGDARIRRLDVRMCRGVRLNECRVGVVETPEIGRTNAEAAAIVTAIREAETLQPSLGESQILDTARSFRTAHAYRSSYDFVYLGDAREEKGFAALPHMLDKLELEPASRRAIVTGQAYVAFDNPDANMLVAAQLLRRRPRNIHLIERSASFSEYNRMLLESDAVLIPYDAKNYAARSSGVFAEAISAGKPAIVPAGSWMAGLLDEASFEHHSVIRRSASSNWVERFLSPNKLELFPQTSESSFPSWRFRDGRILLRGNDTVCFSFPLPEKSNLVYLSMKQLSGMPDAMISALIAYHGPRGSGEIGSDYRWATTGPASTTSIMSRIPPQAGGVWIGLQTPSNTRGFWIENLQVEFLKVDEQVALSPGGVVYAPVADAASLGAKLASSATEIMANYSAYESSAQILARSFCEYHTPAGLADALLNPTPPHQHAVERFSARDWT